MNLNKENGSGALPDRMLLARIIENNKIDAYCLIMIGPRRVGAPRSGK